MNLIKIVLTLGVCLMLGACNAQEDRFTPGTWELEAWMGVEGQSTTTPRQKDTAKLSPQLAEQDARTVMFSAFYGGVKSGDVAFENGTISGHIDQQAVAPFPAHQQAVTGTYSADRFEMRIAMPAIGGMQSYQFVTGRLVKPD
ncbi:MAG: hypothetical protein EAY70_14195 [Sphingomonadales bacterium]|nr:MAG: hypothetical protein EAY70_14195 [Sphingomonadales bacterium]